MTRYPIIDNMPLPKTGRKPRLRHSRYPFAALKVGQGFVVPADEAFWREVTVKSGASAGQVKQINAVSTAAHYHGGKLGRKFTCIPDKDRNIHVKRIK